MLGSGGNGWCWSGMVSLALKWWLPAREHCCFCTPHAAAGFWRYLSMSFHMRIYFQGRTTHAHTEFTMKKFICLIVGWTATHCLVFVPRFAKGKKHLCGWGKCQIVHDPSLPRPRAGCIHNSSCECLSLLSGAPLLVFLGWSHEWKGENTPSALTRCLPFWVRFVLFPPRIQTIL